MATWFSSATRLASLLSVVAVAASLNACTPKPNGPEPAAEEFFAALAKGDTGGASLLTDRPEDARAALNEAWAGLQATGLDAQVLGSKFAEDTGTVGYRYTWHLPKNRTWTYDGQLNMVRNEGHWEVRWTATGLHPKLGEHQTFALRSDPPRRASVNERSGTDVLVPGNLYQFALDAKAAGAYLMTTATAVADALRPFDDTLDAQRLAEEASSSPDPLNLITLRQSDRDQVAAVLGNRPGVVITPQAELLPTDEHFAPAIVERGQEGGGQRPRRPGRLARGQRQPERRGRRRAQRGGGRARAVGHHQPGSRRPERRAERRQRDRGEEGDDRGDQAVHR